MDRTRTLPPPGPGECRVWWSSPVAGVPGLVALLGAAERERWERIRLGAARDAYLAAHALLRLVLGAATGTAPARLVLAARPCAHCGGDHGKPYLAGPVAGLDWSLSHTPGRVVVAVTAGTRVGVDVERVRGAADRTPARALAPGEREVLAGYPPDARGPAFTRYWTRKEAALKATGLGIAGGLGSLEVSPPEEPPAVLSWPGGAAPGEVHLADLREAGPDHAGSLATLGAAVRVVEADAGELLLAAAHG